MYKIFSPFGKFVSRKVLKRLFTLTDLYFFYVLVVKYFTNYSILLLHI